MKLKYIMLSFVSMLAALPAIAMAHNVAGTTSVWAQLGLIDPNTVVIYSAIIIASAVLISFEENARTKSAYKKIIFLAIAIPAVAATLYLGGTTIYLNEKSWSHGPVHWHADYEVWACGEKLNLMEHTGLQNYVGNPLMHTHDDSRIHVEGVIFNRSSATLSEYFEAVGGQFTGTTMVMPTDKADITRISDKDMCNGRYGQWYIFVNGKLMDSSKAPEYVISPYQNVPPGDTIKFVFSEKQPSDINPKLGVAP